MYHRYMYTHMHMHTNTHKHKQRCLGMKMVFYNVDADIVPHMSCTFSSDRLHQAGGCGWVLQDCLFWEQVGKEIRKATS